MTTDPIAVSFEARYRPHTRLEQSLIAQAARASRELLVAEALEQQCCAAGLTDAERVAMLAAITREQSALERSFRTVYRKLERIRLERLSRMTRPH